MSRKPTSVTLKDIAAQAGVSHTAVSAALNGTGRISDEKRERICEVAKQMNYQPHFAAQMLRAHRTGHLGLVICGEESKDVMDSGFFGPVISHFISACEHQDTRYRIDFVSQSSNENGPTVLPDGLAGGMVDGALIAGYYEPQLAHWLEHQNTRPWVGIGEAASHYVKDNSQQNIYQAIQHLTALGHRRIALLHGDVAFNSNEEAVIGFEKACKDFQIQLQDHWIQYIQMMPRRDGVHKTAAWAKKLLTSPDRPTAIICKGMGASRAVVSVAQQLHLDVPGQLSVLGCGTQAESERSYPCMAYIEPDYQQIVHHAMFMLDQLLASRRVQSPSVFVPANIVWNDTVGPPPQTVITPKA